MFDYNVGLNEIVQLVIKTAIPSIDSNNNGKPAQEEAKKSGEKESNDSFEKANGHVSNGDQVIVFSIVEFDVSIRYLLKMIFIIKVILFIMYLLFLLVHD